VLGIRRETDYAVRIVLHLASLDRDAQVTVREIASSRLLPLAFVRRIVVRLGAAGIIATTRGMKGGIRLARPASKVSLLDVVEAMENGIALSRCLDATHSCPLARDCPAHLAWADATGVLAKHLARVRFDRLAARVEGHLEAHRKLIPPRATRSAARSRK